MRVYLSLGSNLGDRLGSIVAAVRAIDAVAPVVAFSPVYETAPLGADGLIVADQPPYLNCVVAVETELGARELRSRTGAIESELGRERRARWESRAIDIDVVLFGDERIETVDLVVPHPRMHERAFVLRPLLDLDPDLSAPGIGSLAALLPPVEWQGISVTVSADEFAALAGLPRAVGNDSDGVSRRVRAR